MAKKKKRKTAECNRNCYLCANCEYIGEGDYLCSESMEIVMADWHPTESFYACDGKDFEKL